jgi:cytochrome P450
VQKIVDELIDGMLAGPKPVHLVEAFALPVPSLVICELLGVPYADHDFFQEHSKTIVKRHATPEQRGAAGHRDMTVRSATWNEVTGRSRARSRPPDRPHRRSARRSKHAHAPRQSQQVDGAIRRVDC